MVKAPGSLNDEELKHRLSAMAGEYLLSKLGAYGVVQTSAPATGSRYLALPGRTESLGRIRIADHGPRKRYFYRWNLWLGKVGYWQESDRKGRVSNHYGINELDRMAGHIIREIMELERDENNDTEAHQDA